MDTKEQLNDNVRSIAHELEAIRDGELYEVDGGEYEIISDMDEWKENQYAKKREEFLAERNAEEYDREIYEDVDKWIEDEIGTADDIDEPYSVSACDYIDKRALSIEHWKIDRDGECVGGEIMFCCGGPTVWATEQGVFGAWGGGRAEYFSSEAGDLVLEYLTETMPSR